MKEILETIWEAPASEIIEVVATVAFAYFGTVFLMVVVVCVLTFAGIAFLEHREETKFNREVKRQRRASLNFWEDRWFSRWLGGGES